MITSSPQSFAVKRKRLRVQCFWRNDQHVGLPTVHGQTQTLRSQHAPEVIPAINLLLLGVVAGVFAKCISPLLLSFSVLRGTPNLGVQGTVNSRHTA